MGYQIRFFLSPKDVIGLEDRLRNDESTIILHSRSRGPFPRSVASTDNTEDGQNWLFYSLVRECDLEAVINKEVPTQGCWTIDQLRSPVTEFSRSFFDGKIIRQGRLFSNTSYYDDNGALVGKTEGFEGWAKGILAKARRFLNYDKELQAYLGADAAQLRKEGIQLVQF